MPTVLRHHGFSVIINTGDHIPPHVHVRRAGRFALINIEDASVRENRGLSLRDLRTAQELVANNSENLLKAWDEIGPIP